MGNTIGRNQKQGKAMITELTDYQKSQMPIYVEKWTKIGLSCEPLDKEKGIDAINRAYTVAGLNPPENFIVCDSPLSGVIASSVGDSVRASVGSSVWSSVRDSVRDSVWSSVRDSVWSSVRDSVWSSVRDSVRSSVWSSVRDSVWSSVGDSVRASVGSSVWDSVRSSVWSSVRDSVWSSVGDSVWSSVRDSVWDSVYGSHDAHWLAFYDFFLNECNLSAQISPLKPLIELAHHCGWWIPYKNVCIIQHRHKELHYNTVGQLHHGSDMAIKYRDGFGVYMWHGRRIDNGDSWIITNPEKISVDSIAEQRNAEIRRIMVERMNPQAYLKQTNSVLIDDVTHHCVSLYEGVLLGEFLQFTLSVCPSTGREYIEFLDPNERVETVQQALNWQFQMPKGVNYNPDFQS